VLSLIRESKFGKTWLVPLHPTSTQALADYALLRDELEPRPRDLSFFVSLTTCGCATPRWAKRCGS
jgi:integrase/recombinase XerD